MAFTHPLSIRITLVLAAVVYSGWSYAQPLTVTLTSSDHNGHAISCFGEKDGEITATVSGGVPPYTYKWSHGDSAAHVTGLAAGYYLVSVRDADTLKVTADITLTQPTAIKVGTTPSLYPNGYNISCTDCFNGSLQTNVAGGVAPYTYLWNDSTTTSNRSALGHRVSYVVVVTDANGCDMASQRIALTQPDRNDWTMEGNVQTDPAQHYLGTADSTDLVLKSNGAERLRLLSSGELRVSNPVLYGRPLYLDGTGVLRGGMPMLLPPVAYPCRPLQDFWPYWETRGNSFDSMCPDDHPVLGSKTAHPLSIITNDLERIHVSIHGKVGIGTGAPSGPINGYRLFVEDGIATRDVMVKLGAWPDYVFAADYPLMPLAELRAYLQSEHHLPGMPSASELETNGGVEVGDMQRRLVRTVEEQALYILQLQEQLARMEQRLQALETSDR